MMTNLNDLTMTELQTLIYDANDIINDLIDCIDSMPVSIQDFTGEELYERINKWNKCLCN